MWLRARYVCAVAVAAVGVPAAALEIRLTPGTQLANNPAALAAFARAAAEWEAVITTPIVVEIDANVLNMGAPNIIGAANFAYLNPSYTSVRDAMAAPHRVNRPGNAILSSLPTAAQFQATFPADTGETTYLFDRTTVGVTQANAKALGLISNPAPALPADGTITFNSTFSFDYDRFDANGIGAGLTDFQSVALHEIGHVLGFISDVDEYDNGYLETNATTLDLFRFNAADAGNVLTPAGFRDTPREMRPGQDAVLSDGVSAWAMSTGRENGDGEQASHWQEGGLVDLGGGVFGFREMIGAMNPTLAAGEFFTLTAADLRAFELIGYDTVVPEPGTLGLVALAGLAALGRRRRRV